MKTRLFILASLLAVFIFSCNNNGQTEKIYPDFGYLMMTPDSLLPAEDLDIKIKLGDIFLSNLKVVDINQVKIDISKSDFLKSGLPEEYYDKMIKDINDFNVGIIKDSTLLSNVNLEEEIQKTKDYLEIYK